MKLVVLLVGVMLGTVVGVLGEATGGTTNPCEAGKAQAFMSIKTDPPYLVGTIPSKYTGDSTYFDRRYSCRHESVQIRRVDLGVYDVFIPGLRSTAPFVTAQSGEGVVASVIALDSTQFRVTLRGPLARNDVLRLRDVPFSMVVF